VQELQDVPFAPLTTVRLGGPSRRLVTATIDAVIIKTVGDADADADGEPLLIIGDKGFDALVDYFTPVPNEVFDAYREVAPLDCGFWQRRELWRLFGYLAVITVDGTSAFGRPFLGRIADAIALYQ
jgi:hypothetical protein